MMMMIHQWLVMCFLPHHSGQTLPVEPPHCTLSDVVKDIVKDMYLTSRTEGADKVVVPEGEVIDTIDNVWDQALVEDVPEPQSPPALTLLM
jgi:hypothetical protein